MKSVMQQATSPSSGESKSNALGSGCARGLIVKHELQEVADAQVQSSSEQVDMNVHTDSDAARSTFHRQGCGRVRYLQTRDQCHEKAMKDSDFEVNYVKTSENPVDYGMKAVEGEIIARCMIRLNLISQTAAGFAEKHLVVALVFLGGTVAGEPAHTETRTRTTGERGDQKGCITEIVITAVVVSLCWIVYLLKKRLDDSMEQRQRGAEAPPSLLMPLPPPAELQRRSFTDIGVQGPETYERRRATPRLLPQADREWGEWPNDHTER
jgi:hypothetical protein